MLATRARVRPWRARFCGMSSGRSTTICRAAASHFTSMSGWGRRDSSPCAPLTLTSPLLTETSRPAATGMGFLPIRDMARLAGFQLASGLPDFAQHFAADVLGLGFAIAEDPLIGGEDGDAQSLP